MLHGVALGHDGVERAFDMGDRRVDLDHAGMDPLLHAERAAPRDAEKLDPEAELLGIGDVFGQEIWRKPSIWTPAKFTSTPKARLARIASLWAVSMPSISKLGSASA